MAELVFLVGASGSGKSSSLRNLNEEETAIINTDQKALPFKLFSTRYNEAKGNYLKSSNTGEVINKIKEIHKNPAIKELAIDTWSRIMTDAVMDPKFRAEKGFAKWGKFSASQYDLLNIINDRLRDDIIVYVMCHPDTHQDEMGIKSEHIAVQGKQLEKFKPESFSSIVLYAEVIKEPGKPNRHVFRTRTSGNDTCKTPMGMFEEDVIDNDLVLISKTIREYYGI